MIQGAPPWTTGSGRFLPSGAHLRGWPCSSWWLSVATVVFVGFACSLGSRYPDINLFGHEAGHRWWVLTGQQGDPHFGVLHLLGFVFLFAGFTLLSRSWHVLHHARKQHPLVSWRPGAAPPIQAPWLGMP